MRERANGYYSPYTYFTAKVRRSHCQALTVQMLFDTIPLRVVPPFILGAIIYKPVGLVPSVPQFWNLILVLVLFNLTASSAIFCLSIIVADGGVANLLGSLIMLYKCARLAYARADRSSLLFAGLLINREKVPAGVGWLQTTSVRRMLGRASTDLPSSSTLHSRLSSSMRSAIFSSSITSAPSPSPLAR